MARNRKPTPTRTLIIKIASELFFQKGFTKTTSTELCRKAEISPGNLTFYFPSKEHILSVLVQMMIDYQWKEMEIAADEGTSSLLAYCLELTTLLSISEEFPEMNDFIVAAYSHPMTLDLIRANDVEKIKRVFAEYTEGWDDDRFTATEAIISGIEYGTVISTEHSVDVEQRISAALNTIMMLFGVPEKLRQRKIEKVMNMDHRSIGRKVYADFKKYVTESNESALEDILKNTKIRTWKNESI